MVKGVQLMCSIELFLFYFFHIGLQTQSVEWNSMKARLSIKTYFVICLYMCTITSAPKYTTHFYLYIPDRQQYIHFCIAEWCIHVTTTILIFILNFESLLLQSKGDWLDWPTNKTICLTVTHFMWYIFILLFMFHLTSYLCYFHSSIMRVFVVYLIHHFYMFNSWSVWTMFIGITILGLHYAHGVRHTESAWLRTN